MAPRLALELRHFRGGVEAQDILNREDPKREHVKEMEEVFIRLVNLGNILKQQREGDRNNQRHREVVDERLQISRAIGIKECGIYVAANANRCWEGRCVGSLFVTVTALMALSGVLRVRRGRHQNSSKTPGRDL